jgi:PAS domain S-box-containing protein
VVGLVVTRTRHQRPRRVESDLRAANSVLAATLESTADGILVVDRDFRITSFNSRFAKMWGLPQSVLESRDDTAAIAFVLEQTLRSRAVRRQGAGALRRS